MASRALVKEEFIFIICLCVFLKGIRSYNVDVNTVLANKGSEGSAFGYSIAQHWDGKKAVLLVGSPLNKSNCSEEFLAYSCRHSKFLQDRELYKEMPGSTYQCDVMGSDSQLKDCSTWITGWETCLPSSLYKLEGLSPPKSYNVQESRKGMGLGTVVHSSSKDPKKNPLKYESLACAPLWSTVLSSEVNMFTMGTCFRKPIETPPSRRAKGYDWFTFSRPAKLNVNSRSDIQDIYQFFHNSAQGFSVDSNKKSKVQVAGAPLANFFRGGFILSLIDEEEKYLGKNNKQETTKVGRYILHYPTGNNRLKRLDKIHYSGMLGYSIALLDVEDPMDPKRFNKQFPSKFSKCLATNDSNACTTEDRKKIFEQCQRGYDICKLSTLELFPEFFSNAAVVAGAPALETSSGALVLFRVVALKNPSFAYKADPYPMQVMWQFNSTEIGERLGTSLLTMDINGDGRDDIISGAPYYTNEKRTQGGRIYLFLSDGKDLIDSDSYPEPVTITVDQEEITNCPREKCYSFQFGKSLANAGDLDGDGIDDLAVGAPYEGLGTFYIFSGAKKSPAEWKNAKPSQKITVDSLGDESVKQALNQGTFGWSLSGGLDMNDDGLIDLSVGAYKSDIVLTFFSRPVIFLEWTFDVPSEFDYEQKKFDFKFCAKVVGSQPKIDNIKNSINYIIYEDLSNGSPQRFKIDDEIGRKEDLFLEVVDINGSRLCKSFTLTLLENTRDLISNLKLTVELQATQPEKVIGNQIKLVNYPSIRDSDKRRSKSIPFKTSCRQVPCRCDLVTRIKPNLNLIDLDKKLYLFDTKENINNTARIAFAVYNEGEEAHDPKLFIESPDSFRLINFVRTENSQCYINVNTSLITCNLKAPLKNGETASVTIDFQFQPSLSSRLSSFRAEAKSISKEIRPESNVEINRIKASVTIDLSLRGLSSPDSLFIEGDVRGASSFNSTKEVGPAVQHIYNVRNEGNFTVQNVLLVVHFPYELKPLEGEEHGKYLLYIEKFAETECSIDPNSAVNPEKYQVVASKTVTSEKSVSKRSTRSLVDEDYGKTVAEGTTLKVGCKLLGAKCAIITCNFKRIESGQSADIKIYSRAWNTTFLQEFSDYETVEVLSEGVIEYGENLFDLTPGNNQFKVPTEIQTSKIFEKDGIKIWQIILAAIGGFLILLIVLLICWKCGFFKRSKRDEMYLHQGKKQKMKDNL